MPSALEHIRRLGPGMSAKCSYFTLGAVEFVKSNGLQLRVRFSVKQGRPPRVFELSASLNQDFSSRGVLWLTSMIQITRYSKYETCKPHGVSSEFCVCDIRTNVSKRVRVREK